MANRNFPVNLLLVESLFPLFIIYYSRFRFVFCGLGQMIDGGGVQDMIRVIHLECGWEGNLNFGDMKWSAYLICELRRIFYISLEGSKAQRLCGIGRGLWQRQNKERGKKNQKNVDWKRVFLMWFRLTIWIKDERNKYFWFYDTDDNMMMAEPS